MSDGAAAVTQFSELVRKVDAIYTALFGMDGQPGTGRLTVVEMRTNDHAERLGTLERWRYWLVGVGVGIGLAVGVLIRH